MASNKQRLKELNLRLANALLQRQINICHDFPELETKEEDLEKDLILQNTSQSIRAKFQECLFNLYTANINSGFSPEDALSNAEHQLIYFIKQSEEVLPSDCLVRDESWNNI